MNSSGQWTQDPSEPQENHDEAHMKQQKFYVLTFFFLALLAFSPSSLAQQAPDGGEGGGGDRGGGASAGRGGGQPAPRAIRGQVMSDGVRRLNHPVPVHLESALGQIFDTVFTDGNGNFTFDQLSGGEYFYIVVDEPGFAPSRTQVTTGPFAMRTEVIILESLDTEEGSPIDPGAVDLSELLADIPDEAVRALEQAGAAVAEGNHERAVEHLEEAIAIAPDFYAAHNALGVSYQALGRREDAVRHFLMAQDLNPNAAAPVLSLGVIYLRDVEIQRAAGSTDEAGASLDAALNYLEDAVELDPRSAPGQYYLGAAHYLAGALENALERFNRALNLNEQFHEVRLMLFNVYVASRDYEAALEQLNSYLELFPDSPQRDAVEQTKAQLEQQMADR
jgi:tetratricopeptide (TPR) repeat protein